MDYEKLHKDTIIKLQQMVNSGRITVETACSICADFVPESDGEFMRRALIKFTNENQYMYTEYNGRKIAKEEFIMWLKSIKDRVQQQPKQE